MKVKSNMYLALIKAEYPKMYASIVKDLKKVLAGEDLENALDCRLCDLEEVINVKKYTGGNYYAK